MNDFPYFYQFISKIHQEIPLLDHYGRFDETAEIRQEKTLTRQDEYQLIVRSLLILDVLSQENLTDEAIAIRIASGLRDVAPEPFCFMSLSSPANVIKNVSFIKAEIKALLSDLETKYTLKDIQKAYIMHDLGKCISFVQELGIEDPRAPAHDEYLNLYLIHNKTDLQLFNKFSSIVGLLDLLGHSPQKIQAPGPFPSLQAIGNLAVSIKEYGEDVALKNNETQYREIATRVKFLDFIKLQADAIQLPSELKEILNRIAMPINDFHQLSMDEKQLIAFVMLTGGLRLEQMSESRSAYLGQLYDAWHHRLNAESVNAFTNLIIANLEATTDAVFIYNATGLLNKSNAVVKAFAKPVHEGGMGASAEEIVSVYIPFLLECIKDSSMLKEGVIGHNEFQVSQLLEFTKDLLPHLAGLTTNQNRYQHVDFGTLEINQSLMNALTRHRDRQSQQKIITQGMFSQSQVDLPDENSITSASKRKYTSL